MSSYHEQGIVRLCGGHMTYDTITAAEFSRESKMGIHRPKCKAVNYNCCEKR